MGIENRIGKETESILTNKINLLASIPAG